MKDSAVFAGISLFPDQDAVIWITASREEVLGSKDAVTNDTYCRMLTKFTIDKGGKRFFKRLRLLFKDTMRYKKMRNSSHISATRIGTM
ncbi:hypothetical protein KSF_085500 [Reticulibacter mediterranei]|uniref:Uncharacterized protein n=1 Tax=Reticulibacter mediterranei TaxID=2778369 RepID=A0A8J3IXA9_9CHLR|nr:hypothetical protein [Reticulibacter mediterranei]GHO98502.1 hypothetical protein KSF_085500 [Reticulibacter mediterranei]